MARAHWPFLLAGALCAGSGAHAQQRARPTDFWRGLDRTRDDDDGARVLETPGPSRVRIAGGTFTMGATLDDMERAVVLCEREVLKVYCAQRSVQLLLRLEGIAHEVTVKSFLLDREEVSVAQYGRCVRASMCKPSATPPGDGRFDRPDLPITFVAWEDAQNYCAWTNGRLPSESEWELAARGLPPPANEPRAARGPGMFRERDFPWGLHWNPHLANHGSAIQEAPGDSLGVLMQVARDATDGSDGYVWLAPVNAYPDGATPEGVLNLAGNAAEWVDDFFTFDKRGNGYAPDGSKAGLTSLPLHVVRGGSFLDGGAWLRGSARSFRSYPRTADVGFRCAQDAAP